MHGEWRVFGVWGDGGGGGHVYVRVWGLVCACSPVSVHGTREQQRKRENKKKK